MAPENSTSTFNRLGSTKNQRADLINELDSFQTSLRNSNASAFQMLAPSNSISKQGQLFNTSHTSPVGLDSLEKSLNYKMKNFHQVGQFIFYFSLWNLNKNHLLGFKGQHHPFTFY